MTTHAHDAAQDVDEAGLAEELEIKDAEEAGAGVQSEVYEAPTIVALGTLAELTEGGKGKKTDAISGNSA